MTRPRGGDADEFRTEVARLERALRAADKRLAKASEEHKYEQKRRDEAEAALHRYIAEQTAELPLFDQRRLEGPGWRGRPLEEMLLSDLSTRALAKAGLTSAGQVADVLATDPELAGVKGMSRLLAQHVRQTIEALQREDGNEDRDEAKA